ncbi:MAG: hypothetical protein COX65_01165, partial [Elusimicrobia bacterium CG_4_10_14_0_2_um_filter_56_8]
MKKTLFAAILLALACGAKAEDFNALITDAPAIKASLPAQYPGLAPELSEIFATSGQGSQKWYGADSRRARMQFTAYMLYKIPSSYTGPVSQILSNSYQREQISELVDLQLQHMYGAFTMHPGFVDNPGIPSG